MERLERFYKIDQLLRARSVLPFAALLEELEVSPATLKRDLQYMRDRFNAPIVYDADAGGYTFTAAGDGPRYELPGLWLSETDIQALRAMLTKCSECERGRFSPLVERLQRLAGVAP